jgi:hypothetical protein
VIIVGFCYGYKAVKGWCMGASMCATSSTMTELLWRAQLASMGISRTVTSSHRPGSWSWPRGNIPSQYNSDPVPSLARCAGHRRKTRSCSKFYDLRVQPSNAIAHAGRSVMRSARQSSLSIRIVHSGRPCILHPSSAKTPSHQSC